jgi:hypothetical protein
MTWSTDRLWKAVFTSHWPEDVECLDPRGLAEADRLTERIRAEAASAVDMAENRTPHAIVDDLEAETCPNR